MQRALRCDGLLPAVLDNGKVRFGPPTLDELRAMAAFVQANRAETTPFDIIMEGTTPGDDRARAAGLVRPWAGAGATWWNEALWDVASHPDWQAIVRQRLRQGPPRID